MNEDLNCTKNPRKHKLEECDGVLTCSNKERKAQVPSVPLSLALLHMFQVGNAFEMLSLTDIFNLTFVSTEVSNVVRKIIGDTFCFYLRLRRESDYQLRFYSPKRVVVRESCKFYFDWNKLLPHTTKLIFGYSINHSIQSLPSKLTHLKLGHLFNESIDTYPQHITHLEFDYCYNQPLTNLPPNLIYLKLGYLFNQKIDHLPNSLTNLILGKSFNYAVYTLPPNIISLEFGLDFNHPIASLPHKLQKLKFGGMFNERFLCKFPPNMIQIIFGDAYNQPIVERLPESLQKLRFGFCFARLVNNLPPNITHLKFDSSYNQPISSLPPKLKYLTLGRHYQYFNEVIVNDRIKLTLIGHAQRKKVLPSLPRLFPPAPITHCDDHFSAHPYAKNGYASFFPSLPSYTPPFPLNNTTRNNNYTNKQ